MTCTCNTDGWPHDEQQSMVAGWKSTRPCCTLMVVLCQKQTLYPHVYSVLPVALMELRKFHVGNSTSAPERLVIIIVMSDLYVIILRGIM